jgi:GntR family transcriptional regulator / MocR family aminotransferase
MIDLFVDPAQSRRTSATLFEQIRDAITSGRLQPGDRLPTSRDLAREQGVARSTIVLVYSRLTAEGFLETRIGDGTFVALHAEPTDRQRRPTSTALAPRRRAPTPARPLPVTALAIDLRSGRPDPKLFPLVDWRRCVVNALQSPPPGYGDPAGLPVLRRVLAAWITRSRGVVTTAEQVVVTSGAQQAFDLFARVLFTPGDTVSIEEPGYPLIRRAFQHHELRVVPVPIDRDGIAVDQLPANTRAVYVTPSHQSPTGVTMSAARRRALLEFADNHDAAIIEDDYDTEYRHVDRPLEPIQRLDTTGRVLYVATFSKTLSPSLRLGFTIVPESLVEPLSDSRALTDTQPPHLTQAALAAFIAEGHLDRHLRRTRRVYRARHDVVVAHITQLHADGLIPAPYCSNAGLHSMISLHESCDANAITTRLAARGIAVDTSAQWWSMNPRPGLVIGFGLADVDQLATAFHNIRGAILAEPTRRHR